MADISPDQGRFEAADWLQSCLENNGHEAGAGWALSLVDGVLDRAMPGLIAQIESLQYRVAFLEITSPEEP